jgi:hypothetical protein
MIDPVPSGMRCKGEMNYGISADFVVEPEDAEASVCKDGMRRLREYVIVGKTVHPRSAKCTRHQIAKVGEVFRDGVDFPEAGTRV